MPVPITVGDMIKRVQADGGFEVHQVGSHRQFKHLTKKGRVTIAGRTSKDLAPFLVNSILRQAGLK